MTDLRLTLLRSITWDQGTEMARHLTITQSLGVPVYFLRLPLALAARLEQNMNGLLRPHPS